MILNSLQSANSVILDSVNAANDKNAIEKYKNQLMALNMSTTQLDQFLKLISLFDEKGIIKKFVSADVKISLTQAVDNCGEKTADHSLDEGTVTALKNAITSLRGELDNAWRTMADARCTPIIESITSLRGLLQNKSEADGIIEYLEKVKTTMPVSATELDKFMKNTDKGKKIVDDLHFDSDPEVKAFIGKVGKQYATIRDLSPHILEWLNNNQLTDKIKLRF